MTPYPNGDCVHETPEQVLKWQRRVVKLWGQHNPHLHTIGLYYLEWRRPVGSRGDCDWGWAALDPENWEYDGR
jgi:hypothetical protein